MSTQRSFRAFTNTAPVSPKISFDGTDWATAKKLYALTFPCNVVNLDGYAAAAGWLQIFDLATAPAGATVPLKSINVPAAGQLSSLLASLGPIPFKNGFFVAMSSTEATYTAVGTNFDIWGEIEEPDGIQAQGISVAGDLTTGVDSLVVWNNASGPKTLIRVDINNQAGTAWLMIFAKDNPVNGDIPPLPPIKLNVAGGVQTFYLGGGNAGISPYSQTAAYAAQQGCTLAISTGGGDGNLINRGLTLAADGASNIQAYYK